MIMIIASNKAQSSQNFEIHFINEFIILFLNTSNNIYYEHCQQTFFLIHSYTLRHYSVSCLTRLHSRILTLELIKLNLKMKY